MIGVEVKVVVVTVVVVFEVNEAAVFVAVNVVVFGVNDEVEVVAVLRTVEEIRHGLRHRLKIEIFGQAQAAHQTMDGKLQKHRAKIKMISGQLRSALRKEKMIRVGPALRVTKRTEAMILKLINQEVQKVAVMVDLMLGSRAELVNRVVIVSMRGNRLSAMPRKVMIVLMHGSQRMIPERITMTSMLGNQAEEVISKVVAVLMQASHHRAVVVVMMILIR
ncbi:unnamed protein product, partial [Gongylonema pulchrum]